MAIGEHDNGWYLHSQGRRFGPLSEDDLRGYFRAGMVKSVDRIAVPGQDAMLAAGEVAEMLGISAPVGPPPPPLPATTAAPTTPAAATAPRAAAGEAAALDERAARAIAAMELELATMAMSKSQRKSSGWLVPVVAGIALVGMLLFGLSMVRNLGRPGVAPATATVDHAQSAQLADRVPVEAVVEAPRMAVEDDAGAWHHKGQQLTDSGNWTALAQHATQWTQAAPNSTQAWHALGLAHTRLGQVEEAVAAFERVLQAEPENNDARILLAETYLGASRWAEAASHYKLLVAALPESPRLWNNYGVVLGKLGQGAQAIAALEAAVRIDPGFGAAWTNLGMQYQAVGDAERATAAFEQAKSLR